MASHCVGNIKLYLLDSDIEQNTEEDRKITYQLYGGDNQTRILQEIVLGIGGVRALRKSRFTSRLSGISMKDMLHFLLLSDVEKMSLKGWTLTAP